MSAPAFPPRRPAPGMLQRIMQWLAGRPVSRREQRWRLLREERARRSEPR